MIHENKSNLCESIWDITKNELCMDYPELIDLFMHPLVGGVSYGENLGTPAISDNLKNKLVHSENDWIELYSADPDKVKEEILFQVILFVLEEREKFDPQLIESILSMLQNRIFSKGFHDRIGQALEEKEIGFHRKRGNTTAGEKEELYDIKAKRNNYRDFLWQFMTTQEELEIDPESFDYIYYTIGMERYGDMPMFEELEYREINRLEQLVIAIDTSGSCKKETVQRFLEETFSILKAKENFFKKMKVYLIQCDCSVQDVTVIRSEEDWKACQKKIVIQGRGGTDFGPVFRYIEKEQKENRLKNLKALIYFTDGDGVYPEHRTPYETAFAFLEENEHMKKVPAWCHVITAGDKHEY